MDSHDLTEARSLKGKDDEIADHTKLTADHLGDIKKYGIPIKNLPPSAFA